MTKLYVFGRKVKKNIFNINVGKSASNKYNSLGHYIETSSLLVRHLLFCVTVSVFIVISV